MAGSAAVQLASSSLGARLDIQWITTMQKSLLTAVGFAVATVGLSNAASAHDARQVRDELRDRGYYQIQFIVDEAPFQVNACRGDERYHLHVDWYGHVTERSAIGECHRPWWRRFGHRYN
jgi:hypothetical protein